MVDLLIIGGGPAGYVAAIRASQLGMSVMLVEKEELGGTCLNRGCVPTKALLYSSSLLASLRDASQFGLLVEGVGYDIEKIYARKDEIVDRLRQGIAYLLKNNKVQIVRGEASFVDDRRVKIGSEVDEFEARNILIATGSQIALPPIEGVEYALTSNEVLSIPCDAPRIAIVGAGVIGLELASHFSKLGREVVVYEFQDRPVAMMDEEISKQLTLALKRDGVKMKMQASVQKIEPVEQELEVTVQIKNKRITERFDKVVCCVGRKPYTDGLGLENTTIVVERGAIVVDERMQSSVSSIYAVGDVTNQIQLAHFASAQGIVAVELMAGEQPSISLETVPSCIYTSPEAASVGVRESDCDREAVLIGRYQLNGNGKALISGENRGFVKTIFDKTSGQLIGAHIVGLHATDLIHELALAIHKGLTHHDIGSLIHAHPTVAESVLESVENSLGRNIHS